MMEELENILNELLNRSNSLDFSAKDNTDLIDRLSEVYGDVMFRHSYYELSLFLQRLSEEERDTVCSNVDKVLAFINESDIYSLDDAMCRGVFKLADHINLETIRINRLKGLEFIGRQAKADIDEAERIYDESLTRVEELKARVNGFQGQSIAVLGIFAGLVIGFATGSDFLVGTLDSMVKGERIIPLIIGVLFIGMVLFNLIFLLMYCIAKISGSSIVASKCKDKECTRCGDCRFNIQKFYTRYPYVVWYNVFTLILTTVLLGVYFLKGG